MKKIQFNVQDSREDNHEANSHQKTQGAWRDNIGRQSVSIPAIVTIIAQINYKSRRRSL